jgi:hypothetical protein
MGLIIVFQDYYVMLVGLDQGITVFYELLI